MKIKSAVHLTLDIKVILAYAPARKEVPVAFLMRWLQVKADRRDIIDQEYTRAEVYDECSMSLKLKISQNNRVCILVGNSSRTSGPRQLSMAMREARGVTEAGRLTLLSSLRPHPTISLFRSNSHRTLVPLSWASSLRFSERVMPPHPHLSSHPSTPPCKTTQRRRGRN